MVVDDIRCLNMEPPSAPALDARQVGLDLPQRGRKTWRSKWRSKQA